MNMNRFGGFVVAMMMIAGVMTGQEKETGMKEETGVYSFTMKTIDGAEKALSGYKGSVIMIVNVASKCGYTPQYEGLEKLYQQYKGKGLVILGFPANNFLWQEPGSDEEIKQFCSIKYNVSFDMFSKISVKGSEMHPLYQYLTKESPYSGGVKWNFQKYLIDRRGNVVAKYAPGTDPLEKEVVQKIEELLAQPS
jgi:glutathione peroxidase